MTIVFAAMWMVMVWAAGLRLRHVATALLVFSVSAPLTVPVVWSQMEGYQRQRITSFLFQDSDPDASYNLRQARISIGTGGLFGTTFFIGDSAAPGPAMAPAPGDTISYSGSLMITTPRGVLQTRDTGIFDQAAGVFSSFDVVDPLQSDGKWAGATGTLFIGGTVVNGQFVTTVMTGRICVPRD
ncbi:MAG: FtsW/RodA/SpoVE family cell cycle protein [Blastochloris sp.]|nr:FtsW/RodA/SpoVE family cell cycle protein [Blastochloris sp.]